MKFTVLWTRYAESKLASLWLRSANRNEVSDAADKIDTILSEDAEDAGESRSANRRVLHQAPLGVTFYVYSDDRKVLVLDVWRYAVHDK